MGNPSGKVEHHVKNAVMRRSMREQENNIHWYGWPIWRKREFLVY